MKNSKDILIVCVITTGKSWQNTHPIDVGKVKGKQVLQNSKEASSTFKQCKNPLHLEQEQNKSQIACL